MFIIFIIPTSVSTMNPKDYMTQPNFPSYIEIHNRNLDEDEVNQNTTSSDIQYTMLRNLLSRKWNSNKWNKTIHLWNLSEGEIN